VLCMVDSPLGRYNDWILAEICSFAKNPFHFFFSKYLISTAAVDFVMSRPSMSVDDKCVCVSGATWSEDPVQFPDGCCRGDAWPSEFFRIRRKRFHSLFTLSSRKAGGYGALQC